MSEYIGVYEAAERFHYSAQNIYYHIKRGNIKPIMEYQHGHGMVQLVKASDVEALAKPKKKDKKKRTTKLHLYEIVLISCGEVTVLYKTCSHPEVARKYINMIEHGHKYVRIRMDGEMLTIHDSDRLANKYHPRTKKGAIA